MSNRGGVDTVAMVLMAALLALVCKAGLAQIGPRYVIDVKLNGAGGRGAAAPGPALGRVQLAGKGLALIRFQGLRLLTVGADADAYSAEAVRDWPAADLVLVTPASAGRYGGLAPLAGLRRLPVVLVEPVAGAAVPPLPPLPPPLSSSSSATKAGGDLGPRYYPMQTWDALHLRKGQGKRTDKTWLRVTAMPGQPGTVDVAGFVLEMGDSLSSYRLYVSCAALTDEEIAGLPQRLPGADLALLPAGDAPQLVPLRRAARTGGKHAGGTSDGLAAGAGQVTAPAPASGRPAALTASGYAFSAIRR